MAETAATPETTPAPATPAPPPADAPTAEIDDAALDEVAGGVGGPGHMPGTMGYPIKIWG